jgi:hypothetical protein
VSILLGKTVAGTGFSIENDHSQNITPQQPNVQHVQGSPMPMGYEQFKLPQNILDTPNSGRIKIESEDFLSACSSLVTMNHFIQIFMP